ncbi:MAG TPA: hypothetical protein VG096_18050 [Bryobacteraceae bacterium]|jgi:hypothetical protein|nr:hypothetical protein [Bryobacteraceae bacterium]
MRSPIYLALLAPIASALAAGSGSGQIGIYHWGGQYSQSVSQGVGAVAALGGKVVRISLSARFYRDYNMGPDCLTGFTLAAAAQDPDVVRALANPGIDVVMITAYDGATYGDCQHMYYLDPAFFTPENTAAVRKEYSDLTFYLYRKYRLSRKQFIISDWEGDNSIYCGDAYKFALVDTVRSQCLSEYQSQYGVASPAEAFEGFRLWQRARALGIADGRARARARGIGGQRVYLAPEFNMVRALHDHGFQSVLYDVLPLTTFDYVSYSSWESINTADPAGTLLADLATIQEVTGANQIIIGETGFSRSAWPGQDVVRTSDVISAALNWGAAYIFQWNLYDTDANDEFGLYNLQGQATPLALWFQNQFQPIPTLPPLSP